MGSIFVSHGDGLPPTIQGIARPRFSSALVQDTLLSGMHLPLALASASSNYTVAAVLKHSDAFPINALIAHAVPKTWGQAIASAYKTRGLWSLSSTYASAPTGGEAAVRDFLGIFVNLGWWQIWLVAAFRWGCLCGASGGEEGHGLLRCLAWRGGLRPPRRRLPSWFFLGVPCGFILVLRWALVLCGKEGRKGRVHGWALLVYGPVDG